MTTGKRLAPLKPRKLPRQARAEHTVAAILEAAALVLEAHGMDGFNTNLVAQRAGVSIGSLYQYFPGKDALVVALCQRERAVFLAEAESASKEVAGATALQAFIAAAVRHQLGRPGLARLLDAEEGRPAIARELAVSTAVFRELLRQIVARGDMPVQPDIEAATDDLVSTLRAIVDAAGDRGEDDPAALRHRVERAMFGYLGITAEQP